MTADTGPVRPFGASDRRHPKKGHGIAPRTPDLAMDWGAGIVVGLGIGLAIGLAIESIGAGIGIGLAFGIAIAVLTGPR